MDLQVAIQFANQNPICYVATAEGDQPRVRGFMMWFADETGFYFHTGAPKRVSRQLQQNPKVEVCFFAPEPEGAGRMLRVSGRVEFVDDLALKKRLLDERPFLKALATGEADPGLAVFRIYTGEAVFWTMANNMHEAEAETVKF